ncbi:MAG: hypothetical protein K0S65_5379 [Labilithrix sp.]|nr:hypothetical protein [Labilithrix sp.]
MGRRRPEWIDHVVAARRQTLEDVALAEMGTVAVLSGDVDAEPFIEALADSALADGFAVATASLAETALHDLHAVVASLARSLRVPGVTGAARGNGLVLALDVFVAEHGRRSEDVFEEAASTVGLGGELLTLAREYIGIASGVSAPRKLQAWLGGRHVTLKSEELRPLAVRTAKRALVAFTRLLLALGHRGARIILHDAEALIDLPPARRDVAYSVLRELIDNGDGVGGMVATEVLLIGTGDLDRRVHSLVDHPALATRVVADVPPGPPIPHQTWIPLEPPTADELPPIPAALATSTRAAPKLRALVRIAQGLPPHDVVPELTIGMEEVDRRIEQLFEAASNDGSVFAILMGEYGAGKTHHLLLFEARAIAARRPLLRLAVERLDEDLGNPQRHLRRVIESAIVPGPPARGLFECLERWFLKPTSRKRLAEAMRAIAASESEAARPAQLVLGDVPDAELDRDLVLEVLGALDLVDKPNAPTYRKDAYARLQLWLELLERLEGCEGPVVILDEAENLYRPGVSRSERRTALRSLAHYCGGAIPRATVVLALTPETLASLREEASALLDEIEDQATLLPSEDVVMLRRRLLRARPIQVKKLDREDLETLAGRVRKLAKEVRGKHVDRGIGAFLDHAVRETETPRDLLRRVILREERLAWLGEA